MLARGTWGALTSCRDQDSVTKEKKFDGQEELEFCGQKEAHSEKQ